MAEEEEVMGDAGSWSGTEPRVRSAAMLAAMRRWMTQDGGDFGAQG